MKDEEVKVKILGKLRRLGYWGGRHTSVENLTHGFPGHIKKQVTEIIGELLKSGWFIVKPKPDSLHISLNPRATPEIFAFLESQGINTTSIIKISNFKK